MNRIGPADIDRMCDALTEMSVRISQYLAQQGEQVHTGSQAQRDRDTVAPRKSIDIAISVSNLLIESAVEHIRAFVKTMAEPKECIACFTVVRSMLEPCALVCWLLQQNIDITEREGRIFGLRYDGMEQQRKWATFARAPEDQLAALSKRIDVVEQEAIALGYDPILDNRGRRTGIGRRVPGATENIGRMIDEESMYRLLSAVTHGHSWAIRNLSYAVADPAEFGRPVDPANFKIIKKTPMPQAVALLAITAASAFGRAILHQCRYCGWDENALTAHFEVAFDTLQATEKTRFWR